MDFVSNGAKYYVNNYDNDNPPEKKETIVAKALEAAAVGKRKYNLFKYNCEHFATEMRYGKEFSKQVQSLGSNVYNYTVHSLL